MSGGRRSEYHRCTSLISQQHSEVQLRRRVTTLGEKGFTGIGGSMTHNEKRGSASREAALALFTGGIYGASHTISGHPLDTIKSKMQISGGEFKNANAFTTARIIMEREGLVGFFRGVVPPLWGSVVYRGIMMSSYEYGFTYLSKTLPEDHWLKQEIFLGLRPMVLAATVFSSLCRCGLENPIEYAKVMGQTGKKWVVKDIYRGVSWQIVRTTGKTGLSFPFLEDSPSLMSSFFPH